MTTKKNEDDGKVTYILTRHDKTMDQVEMRDFEQKVYYEYQREDTPEGTSTKSNTRRELVPAPGLDDFDF